MRVDVLRLVKARAHEDAYVMDHAELDRAHLQHLGAERRQLQHFLEADAVEPTRARLDPRIRRVDAVDVGVDVAAVGGDRGRDGHGRCVRSAAAQRGDAAGVLVDALEAGDHCDFPALDEAAHQFAPIDLADAGAAMGVVGVDRNLPALPRSGRHPDRLQHNGKKPRGDLLARGHHGVVFARVMQRCRRAAPFHQLVGHARQGGDDDGDLMAGVDLALDVARDVADAVEIGDRGSAELHHQAAHGESGRPK